MLNLFSQCLSHRREKKKKKRKKPFSRPLCGVSRVLGREHKSYLVLTHAQVTLPLPAVSNYSD